MSIAPRVARLATAPMLKWSTTFPWAELGKGSSDLWSVTADAVVITAPLLTDVVKLVTGSFSLEDTRGNEETDLGEGVGSEGANKLVSREPTMVIVGLEGRGKMLASFTIAEAKGRTSNMSTAMKTAALSAR